ncbi:hypothetical protein AYL20_05450 [Acinetobacter venetianus]|uniref:hypothetical protein n=1 Tax=Acinetobacter venetianus TaxID=52133 RepID=UPI000775F94E|nr:hypothetical protein [Acinetobacter venetianus]KXO80285.1 hypothetical protein AYL20_05450 [Acinetobacter venetianus]
MLKTIELFNGKKININIVKGQIIEIREYVENDKNLDTQKAKTSQDQILIMTSSQREMVVYLWAQDISLSVGQQISIAFLENDRDNYLILYNQENRQLSLLQDGNWLKFLDKHKILRPKRYVLWSIFLTAIISLNFVLGLLGMATNALGGLIGDGSILYAFCPIFIFKYFFNESFFHLFLEPLFLWFFLCIWGFFYFISTRIFLYFWENQAVDKIREQVVNSFTEEVDS